MIRILLFAATFISLGVEAKQGWIVGDSYLARWNGNTPPIVQGMKAPTSWNFDAKSCGVGVTTEGSTELSFFDWSGAAKSVAFSGRIVSEVEAGAFYAAEANQITRYSSFGEKGPQYAFPDTADLVRLVMLSSGQSLGLFFRERENRVWVRRFDSQFQLIQEIPVATAYALWGSTKLLVEPDGRAFWVGYSASTPKYVYTPWVARFELDGKRTDLFSWEAKGLFFDLCNTEGGVLMSRDVPSYPYTLPVYSFLEELVSGAKSQTLHEVETNYFVDFMSCGAKQIWMVQRSIHGSDGSYLVRWDRERGGRSEKVARLPGPARAFYACDEPLR